MAATNFTPISLYYSTTAAAAPTSGNLVNGELGLNITDGKLYYKDNSGVVQLLASKAALTSVDSISFGTTGLTPNTATTGAVTVAGTLVAANGGTGQASYAVGDLLYASTTTALSRLADVATGNALISGGVGVAPSWGKIGLTTHVSGTLGTTNGGTGLTSFTANGIAYASSTSALATGSALTFDGTNFATTGNATAKAFIPSSSTVPTLGMYAAGTALAFATNSTLRLRITNDGEATYTATGLAGTGSTAQIFNLLATATSVQTALLQGFQTTLSTDATYTGASVVHYSATEGTYTVAPSSSQTGFQYSSLATGAANNYAFASGMNAATGRYNLYMNGTANNYLAGSLGIGTSLPTTKLHVRSDANALTVIGQIQNRSAGASAGGVIAFINSATDLTDNRYSYIGALTTGATQNGNNLVFATNTNANAAVERMRIDSAGAVGIGGIPSASDTLRINKNITGATTAYGVYSTGIIQTDVTTLASSYSSTIGTAASTTIASIRNFAADQGTFGAGSAVTNSIGYWAGTSLTGATNNYGFFGNIAAGTGEYNLYMNGTADNYLAGRLGIGSTSLTDRVLSIGSAITGGTASFGIAVGSTISSDVTNAARIFQSSPFTQAASFTLGTLTHYYANQAGIGAGSTVTNQYGFLAESTLTGATNNYGFFGNIAAAANRFNLYMGGTADNYLAGRLGIGSTSLTDRVLSIGGAITGSANSLGIAVNSTVASDVTTSARIFQSSPSTQAASFTLGSLQHYTANQATIGAGSTVTNQYGFLAESTLTGATANFGFFGNISAGTNRFNLYMSGTAANYMAGSLGIGTTSVTTSNLRMSKNITGGTAATGFSVDSTIQSDVTSDARYYRTNANTAAAAFTLPTLNHFFAAQGTFGASSIVTTQAAFQIETNITGATTNYGFLGALPATTSGIATTGTISNISSSGTTVTVNHDAIAYTNGQTVTVTATANATALVSGATCTILTVGTTDFTLIGAASNTVGVSFTATGAGTGTGTVTLNVQGSGKTVAGAASGSFTFTSTTSQTFAAVTVLTGTVVVSRRFNLYMQGTAPNHFAGDVLVFGAGGLGYTTGSGGAVTQGTSRTTGVTLNKTNGAITLFSAAGSITATTFTVTNSTVAATDTIIVNQKSGTNLYIAMVTAVAAGSFNITFYTTGGVATDAPVFNFAVIKAVVA